MFQMPSLPVDQFAISGPILLMTACFAIFSSVPRERHQEEMFNHGAFTC